MDSQVNRRLATALATLALAPGLLGAGTVPAQLNLIAFARETAASLPHATRSEDTPDSYRITMTTSRGDRLVGIQDGPRRYELVGTSLGTRSIDYFVGGMFYSRVGQEPWTKIDVARFTRAAQAKGMHARSSAEARKPKPIVHNLPDRRVHGVLMGAVSFTSSPWWPDPHFKRGQLVTVTCLYTKEGREYQSCTAPGLYTFTFDRYGDPANHFVVPREALNAPLASWATE